MDKFRIRGGRKLEGTVRISGAKNAALPAMAAALLTADAVNLKNIPHVRDIITMAKLLAHMRCRVEIHDTGGKHLARGSSLRTCEDHEGFGFDPWPARRAIRLRSCFSAWRLLDWC